MAVTNIGRPDPFETNDSFHVIQCYSKILPDLIILIRKEILPLQSRNGVLELCFFHLEAGAHAAAQLQIEPLAIEKSMERFGA